MSRTARRLALIALVLCLSLTMAAAPAQARESPTAGWFSTLTHQLMQWTAGWWTWPAPAPTARAGQVQAHAAKGAPPVTIDCGPSHDPNGGCTQPAPPQR